MILQVHDELVFEVAHAELERLERRVTERMQRATELSVPLVVHGGVGRTGWPRIRKEADKDGAGRIAGRAKVKPWQPGSKGRSRVDAVVTFGRLPGLAPTGPEAARTDAELIREAQADSHAAFETLVRRYAERAYRAAYRVVRDQQAAEEVLQEALIKAYRALPRFEARSSFYTWLSRLTVGDCRRRGKRVEWDDTTTRSIRGRLTETAIPIRRCPDSRRTGGVALARCVAAPARSRRSLLRRDRREHADLQGNGHEPATLRTQEDDGFSRRTRS
jgi:RNA polymerase sigma factor (sigma-70 family)